jgi:hypothetical protein
MLLALLLLCVVLLHASAAEGAEGPKALRITLPSIPPRPSGRCPHRPLTFLVHGFQLYVFSEVPRRGLSAKSTVFSSIFQFYVVAQGKAGARKDFTASILAFLLRIMTED